MAPISAISPEYSCPIVIGVGIVFCAHSSQLKMCTSVPQMPVLWTFTRTSSGPIDGNRLLAEPEARLRLLLDKGFHGRLHIGSRQSAVGVAAFTT